MIAKLVVGVVLVDGYVLLLWWDRYHCHFDTTMISDLVVEVLVDYCIDDSNAPIVSQWSSGCLSPHTL